jgi:hypothetical protein
LEELTFRVEQFCALSVPRGRSAPCVFVACSSCSYSSLFSIRHGFKFWLGKVSDGPRVPGGQFAGAWRTVRVLPADGLLFAVRLWRFCCLFRTVCGKGANSPRYPAGQSARPLRTVCPAWPDSPPEIGCFVLWFDSFFVSFVLPLVLHGVVPKTRG